MCTSGNGRAPPPPARNAPSTGGRSTSNRHDVSQDRAIGASSCLSTPIAPNVLARRFEASAPNRVWVTDITYLWTLEGWLYLVVTVDLFSRRVVGWAMSERMTRHLALDALTMALTHRQPAHGLGPLSDRGSQYASHEYRRLLAAHGIVCSMSRRGDCWDNAVAESFFSALKLELV